MQKNYGDETNRLYRRERLAVTWNGGWDNGDDRQQLGAVRAHPQLAYSAKAWRAVRKGIVNEQAAQDFADTDLADVMLHSEVNLPIDFLVNQNADAGHRVEPAADEGLDRLLATPRQLAGTHSGGAIDGASATDRSPYSSAEIFSLFAENNMELTDSTMRDAGAALRSPHVSSATTGARR